MDARVYPREAVFAACRRWSVEAGFKIVKSGKNAWGVTATAKGKTTKTRLRAIREGFEDEAMHQELRAQALKDAGKVREAVILRALVSAASENS
jgi:His-Xaa-Ser system protein HxsD